MFSLLDGVGQDLVTIYSFTSGSFADPHASLKTQSRMVRIRDTKSEKQHGQPAKKANLTEISNLGLKPKLDAAWQSA